MTDKAVTPEQNKALAAGCHGVNLILGSGLPLELDGYLLAKDEKNRGSLGSALSRVGWRVAAFEDKDGLNVAL